MTTLASTLKDSSPGYPYLKKYNSQRDLPIDWLVEVCIQRLALQAVTFDVELSPEEKVECGLMDPIRIFVKNEGHKSEKRRTKRVRLIHSVSAVDNLLLKFVVVNQNTREISSWTDIPSAPGIGFSAIQVAEFLDKLPPGPYGHSDMSGWDFSVQDWEIELGFLFRTFQEHGGAMPSRPSAFIAALYLQLEMTGTSVFVLADGTLLSQDFCSWMKTGGNDTSSGNSKIRSCIHRLCGGTWNRAAGDDLVGDVVPDYENRAAAYGHTMRDAKTSTGWFRFCSADWDYETGVLVHEIAKPLFNLVNKPFSIAEREQFLEFLRGHPDEDQVRAFLTEEWQDLSNASKEEIPEGGHSEEDPEGPFQAFKD